MIFSVFLKEFFEIISAGFESGLNCKFRKSVILSHVEIHFELIISQNVFTSAIIC